MYDLWGHADSVDLVVTRHGTQHFDSGKQGRKAFSIERTPAGKPTSGTSIRPRRSPRRVTDAARRLPGQLLPAAGLHWQHAGDHGSSQQPAGSSNASPAVWARRANSRGAAEARIRWPSPSRKHRNPAWVAKKKKKVYLLALVLSKASGSGWLC